MEDQLYDVVVVGAGPRQAIEDLVTLGEHGGGDAPQAIQVARGAPDRALGRG